MEALVYLYIFPGVGEVRVGIQVLPNPSVPRAAHASPSLLCRVLSIKHPVPKNQTPHKLEMIRAPPKLKNTRVKRSRQNARKSNPYKSIVPSRIVRTRCGFPDTLQTTLRYQETLSLSSSSGALFGYVYNLNGLYDPNHTGTGHQPLYFDQLMTIYNHYIVIGAKITVKFTAYPASIPVNVCLPQR